MITFNDFWKSYKSKNIWIDIVEEIAEEVWDYQQVNLDVKDKELYDKDMCIQTLEEQIQGLKINDYALCEYANDKDKEIEKLRLSLQEAIKMHVDSCKF